MKRILTALMTFSLALTLVVASSCDALANSDATKNFKPITLKFANQHPVNSIASIADRAMCEEIEKATEGRVKVKLYTDSSLGDYTSVFEEVMVGSIDMAHTTPIETYDARMSGSMLPYLAPSYELLKKAYSPDNFLFEQVTEASNGIGLHFLGFFCEGYNGFGIKGVLENPALPGADKGIVVRSPGAAIYAEGTKELGFRTSSIAYSDTYTAIQTGVVDGWVGGPANLNYLYFRDVIDHFYNYQYNQESTIIYMNQKKYNSLLPQDREAIDRIVAEKCASSIVTAETDDAKYMALLEEAGITVVNFTAEERSAFANHIRTNVWPTLAKNTSQEFIDGVIKSMK